MNEGQEAINLREALIEMYKAGFLDASKPKTKKDHDEMNKKYRLAFLARFEKSINSVFKKHDKRSPKKSK